MATIDYRLLTDDGVIDLGQWSERHGARLSVGTCDRPTDGAPCPGLLIVQGDRPWAQAGSVRWLTAVCATCGAEAAMPNGRVRRRATAPA